MTYRPMMAYMDRLLAIGAIPTDRPLVIVDVGSGYGGMLRKIDAWATKRGIAVDLTGVDLNPWSAAASTAATPPGRPVRWLTAETMLFRTAG